MAKKQITTTLVAVKIPTSLDKAIELRCWRDNILKREFVALACRNRLPLVQTPPRGLWQKSGTVRTMTLEGWIGRDIEGVSPASQETIVRRYLAAFGPASPRAGATA